MEESEDRAFLLPASRSSLLPLFLKLLFFLSFQIRSSLFPASSSFFETIRKKKKKKRIGCYSGEALMEASSSLSFLFFLFFLPFVSWTRKKGVPDFQEEKERKRERSLRRERERYAVYQGRWYRHLMQFRKEKRRKTLTEGKKEKKKKDRRRERRNERKGRFSLLLSLFLFLSSL